MFVPAADATCLRQGDILSDIVFPRLSSSEITILGRIVGSSSTAVPNLLPVTNSHRNDPNWVVAQVPARLSFCAVLSQCCDLEPRNDRLLMPTFIVARLLPIPKNITADSQRLASLKNNKDPRVGTDPGYINLFYIPAHPLLDNSDWIVDYNQAICIPGLEFPAILSKKILQMEDSWRVKFKIKLAACLTRLTDNERTAGLENPWSKS